VIQIDTEKCVRCGGCVDLCPTTAIAFENDVVVIDPQICLECETCIKVCPMKAPHQVE
jgi:ferredoxin